MTEIAHSTPDDIAVMTDRAREVVRLNIEALEALERSIDVSMARAVDVIMSRPGYVVVTGMGKSGHIGGKIAATLASTGTNAFFVHPAEMSHGDLGMLRPDVTVLAISNSGESRSSTLSSIVCAPAISVAVITCTTFMAGSGPGGRGTGGRVQCAWTGTSRSAGRRSRDS